MNDKPAPSPMLELSGVRFGYADKQDFLGPVDWTVAPGHLWGVLGPNGAGKSTLLRLAVGLLAPSAGRIRLCGTLIGDLSPRDRARIVSFLPQQPTAPPAATVAEVVMLGRFPHRPYHLFDTPEDLAAAHAAMVATRTASFADRPMRTLSGGEAQRVHLAGALAQAPRLLVLDEPTAALDLYHQLDVFDLLRQQVDKTGMSAIVVTHDLNLADRYCDRLLLLEAGRPAARGGTKDVLALDVLERVYQVRFTSFESRDGRQRWIAPATRMDAQRNPTAGRGAGEKP
jgi:iron complex transport system ATP-binding protein